MGRPSDILPVVRSDRVCHQHVCSDGKSDEHVDDQCRNKRCSSDRRHCIRRREMTDYDQIRRTEQQLQNPGKKERHGEQYDFSKKGTSAHIDMIFVIRILHRIRSEEWLIWIFPVFFEERYFTAASCFFKEVFGILLYPFRTVSGAKRAFLRFLLKKSLFLI